MRKSMFLFTAILMALLVTTVSAQDKQLQRFHATLSGGFGLPKINYSDFRTPVSLLGGAGINLRVLNKWSLQADAYALTTYSLGTGSGRDLDIKFNLMWGSFAILRHLRGVYEHENFVLVSVGRYHISQTIAEREDDLNSMGISLGMVDWRHWERWSMVTEIRWHMLFEPTPKPQVLTITVGILL